MENCFQWVRRQRSISQIFQEIGVILSAFIMGTVTIIQCKGTTWFPFKALEHSERVQSEVGEFDLKEEAQR
jgi:hypothetical protein